MKIARLAVMAMVMAAAPLCAQDAPQADMPVTEKREPHTDGGTAVQAVLAAGTPIFVFTNQELSSKESEFGDRFSVTVVHDVTQDNTLVIPKGTLGMGEVTFRTGKGGFGKPGIIGIALRTLTLGDREIVLDGRYREEGGGNAGAVVATWFAVGVFSGFIQGKTGAIPKGRELKARTGEDLPFIVGSQPPPPPPMVLADAPVAEAARPAP